MAKSLSFDLRQRVMSAIEGGLSCRQAAQRFGVSAASAIRWRDRQQKAGDFASKQQGGDRRSQRIEAHAQLILDTLAVKPDITLAELRGKLMEQAWLLASPRSGGSSIAERSRSKKDGARRRTKTPGYKCRP